MGALIEPAGKSTTANSVPRYSKAFEAKEWQNGRIADLVSKKTPYQYVNGQIVHAGASVES
jgi:hypothetical protein